jgi:hypothetical protein
MTACDATTAMKIPYVCALVAMYEPPEPMDAAAAIWTAHPQSMDATA